MFYNNEVRVLGVPEKDKAPTSHDGLNDGFYVTLTRHKMCASLCAFFYRRWLFLVVNAMILTHDIDSRLSIKNDGSCRATLIKKTQRQAEASGVQMPRITYLISIICPW